MRMPGIFYALFLSSQSRLNCAVTASSAHPSYAIFIPASICQTFLPLLYFHPETMLFYSPFFFSKAAPNHTMSVPFSPISGEFPLTSNFVRLKRLAKDDLHLPPKPLPDSKSIFPNKSRHPFAYAMRQFPNPLLIRLLSAPTQRTPNFSAKDNIHSKRSRFLLNFSSVVPTSFSKDRCLRSS